jgi:hypothetical protein
MAAADRPKAQKWAIQRWIVLGYGRSPVGRFHHENLIPHVHSPAFGVIVLGTILRANGTARADKVQNEFDRTVPPPIHQQAAVDFEKLKADADELVILSQSTHSGVDSVEKGMLPKDLIDKLKQWTRFRNACAGNLPLRLEVRVFSPQLLLARVRALPGR